MKVLITDKINEAAGKILDGVAQVDFIPTLPEDELAEKIKEYDKDWCYQYQKPDRGCPVFSYLPEAFQTQNSHKYQDKIFPVKP